MALFLVATKDAHDALHRELLEQFPDDVLRIADNQWFVATKMTTKALGERIDPGEGGKWGEWVLVKFGNYIGWNDLDTWDWVELKRSENRHG